MREGARGVFTRRRPTHGVEYAVLSGVIACSLVLAASVFGPELAGMVSDLTCRDCVVSLERRAPQASTASAAAGVAPATAAQAGSSDDHADRSSEASTRRHNKNTVN
jgi:hypothetical protein